MGLLSRFSRVSVRWVSLNWSRVKLISSFVITVTSFEPKATAHSFVSKVASLLTCASTTVVSSTSTWTGSTTRASGVLGIGIVSSPRNSSFVAQHQKSTALCTEFRSQERFSFLYTLCNFYTLTLLLLNFCYIKTVIRKCLRLRL